MTVRVVVPLPVDQAYTYRVPHEFRVDVRVGCRVVVPFGHRVLTGMVVEITDESGRLKAIRDVLDDEPAFTEEMLRLTRWIADYYACGWGEVVKAALPGGIEVESKRRIYRNPKPPRGNVQPAAPVRALLTYLEANDGATLPQVNRALSHEFSLYAMRKLADLGWVRIEQELAPPKVRVKRQRHVRLADGYRTSMGLRDLKKELRGVKQRAVVDSMARYLRSNRLEPAQTDLLSDADASASTVNSLIDKGVLEVVEKEVVRTPLGDLPIVTERPVDRTLHPAQAAALEAIDAATDAGEYRTFLLHGVTGSGKTEVYIRALRRVLEAGKSGIVLVPEIALTPQTVQRFRSALGDEVEVLHSRMSPGERFDVWRNLRKGVYRVVIGPRSAILAPLSNLGLIIVDEEHETSYKQFDPAPRYHARDVAVLRARMNDAVCVLGSATPSIESYVNARSGKYTLLEMPDRVPVAGRAAAMMPEVHVVDLALEKKKHQLKGYLSNPLRNAIGQRLERNEQVILLQNRRGYASVLECQDCGWSPHCRDCAVTLTFHKARYHLRCHYCGNTRRVPVACPNCESPELKPHGAGTQRVEEELERLFPDARLLRMDFDTTRRKESHRTILSQFRRGKADILVGTQMVAKGLDFARVTLVGVVNADTGLLLPDFRAAERTFQMLTQVAGRAGRSHLVGEVILQTRNPDQPVIGFARQHDYHAFIERELPDRQTFGYPPFGRLIGVEFRGPREGTTQDVAREWTAALRDAAPDLEILGPEAAFVGRVKRLYRFQTIVKLKRDDDPAEIKRRIRAVDAAFGNPPKDHRIILDVDPYGLF